MDSGVTGFTEGNEVVTCVCAALRERYLVMHLFGGGQPAIPLAQLTQRMLLDVPVADALPGAAIPAAYSRVTVVLLVAFGFRLGVLLAPVERHNEICRIITEISELRKLQNPPVTGYEFHIINMVSFCCPQKLILP